jgi:nitrite reductase/ring-hydroxylating ferredoxin subunit
MTAPGPGARLCDSAALTDGGPGVRFTLPGPGDEPAFVIRHRGQVYAYRNRCAHRRVELDWEPGAFFDRERRLLVCATHGALYEPATGACRGGPCGGAGLEPVAVVEGGGAVWLVAAPAAVVK